MAPVRNMQRKGPELTIEIIHLPMRQWQLLQQTQIVAWFNKASIAQIPHLIYQQDAQIAARAGDTLSGRPAGVIWGWHGMGFFGVAHQSLICPFVTLFFSRNSALNPAWSWNQWFCFPIWNINSINAYSSFLTDTFSWRLHCHCLSDSEQTFQCLRASVTSSVKWGQGCLRYRHYWEDYWDICKMLSM